MRPTPFLVSYTRAESGVAALEFALILPLLVFLFFGAVELSNLLIADSKLRNVASSISDLLTQKSNGTVSETDLNVANLAASQIMLPLSTTGTLAILTTTFRPVDLTTSRVLWSRIIIGGVTGNQVTPALGLVVPNCSNSGLPATLLPKASGSPFNDVLQVTAIYNWSPWFATIFPANIGLRSTNYNMPRYTLTLNPGSTLTPPCPP